MTKRRISLTSLFIAIIFAINLIVPHKVMASEKKDEVLLKEINTLKEEVKESYSVDYLKALTFRALGEPLDEKDIRLNETKRPLVYCQNIIKLFSAKEDLSKEENKKYIDRLKNSLSNEGFKFEGSSGKLDLDLNGTALGIITLNMVDAHYDKEVGLTALTKYIKKDIEENDEETLRGLSLALIALEELEKNNEYIEKIKEKIKTLNNEGKITLEVCDDFGCEDDYNINYNSLVIQGLIGVGEDPTSEEFEDSGKNLIDGLEDFKVRNDEEKIAKLAALTDYYNFKYENKKSMYFQKYEKVYPKEIRFKKDNIKGKLFKEIPLEYDLYDNKGNIMPKGDVVITKDNNNIEIKGDSIIPIKEGITKVEVALKENKDIKSTLTVECYKGKVEKINIELDEDLLPLKINDEIKLKIKALDSNGDEVPFEEYIFKSSNNKVLSVDEKGLLRGTSIGKGVITAYLKSDNKIKVSREFEVKKPLGLNEITKEENQKIKSEIDRLLHHYEEVVSVEGIGPLALEKFGINKEIYVSKHLANVYDYSKALFAIKGSKGNVENYNNKNYLKELEESQVKEGPNKGLFIKNSLDEESLAYQCYAILALDLCNGNYDKESAIRGIIKLYNSGKYNVNSFSESESKGLLLTVLAGVDRSKEVNKITNELIISLKNDSKNDIAFNSRMEPRGLSIIIEALVANDINPLGEGFTNNKGEDLLDKLLSYKAIKLKYGEKVSGFTNGKGEVTYDECTNYALAALSDLYSKKSIFGVKTSVDLGEEVAPPIIEIEGIKDNGVYNNDVNIKISSDKGKTTAKLNGKEFNGGLVKDSGTYNLDVQAIDDSGNKSVEKFAFIVDKNEKSSIRVRVEGREKTLFNKEVFFGDGGDNPLDILKIAVGPKEVTGTSGEYGFFIKSILGEHDGDNYGFCYVLLKNNEILTPQVSTDKFEGIKDKLGNSNYDELVFYVSDFRGSDFTTELPLLKYEINKEDIILKFSTEKGPLVNEKIKINGEEKTTDSKGEILLHKKDSNEEFNIEVGRREKTGGIGIVPFTFKVKIDKEAGVKPEVNPGVKPEVKPEETPEVKPEIKPEESIPNNNVVKDINNKEVNIEKYNNAVSEVTINKDVNKKDSNNDVSYQAKKLDISNDDVSSINEDKNKSNEAKNNSEDVIKKINDKDVNKVKEDSKKNNLINNVWDKLISQGYIFYFLIVIIAMVVIILEVILRKNKK